MCKSRTSEKLMFNDAVGEMCMDNIIATYIR